MRDEVQWTVDATLQLARLVINNPTITMSDDKDFLYELNDTAELGEPNATATLFALKLSWSKQFANRAGGCALAHRAAAGRDAAAEKLLDSCKSWRPEANDGLATLSCARAAPIWRGQPWCGR